MVFKCSIIAARLDSFTEPLPLKNLCMLRTSALEWFLYKSSVLLCAMYIFCKLVSEFNFTKFHKSNTMLPIKLHYNV